SIWPFLVFLELANSSSIKLDDLISFLDLSKYSVCSFSGKSKNKLVTILITRPLELGTYLLIKSSTSLMIALSKNIILRFDFNFTANLQYIEYPLFYDIQWRFGIQQQLSNSYIHLP